MGMEFESNNNTQRTANKMENSAEKRAATAGEDYTEDTKRLKLDESAVAATQSGAATPEHVPPTSSAQRPPPQSPKKRLQLEKGTSNNAKSKFNKSQAYIYGNYKHYYGKRILDKDFQDIRLDVLATQPELFRDKQLLDIGCNSGHLSIEIVKRFAVKSLVGLDIDRSLIETAQLSINSIKRSLPAEEAARQRSLNQYPFNMKFLYGNYVLDDDVLLEIERPQFDVILCLSVTKWIHLNFCDAGLKQAFRRMFLQLRPGGKLILEPQAYDTYRRRKKLNDKIRLNFDSITFKPDDFPAYLLSSEVGFASMELMGVPEHCDAGFKRPIQIFQKAQQSSSQ